MSHPAPGHDYAEDQFESKNFEKGVKHFKENKMKDINSFSGKPRDNTFKKQWGEATKGHKEKYPATYKAKSEALKTKKK